METVHFGTFYRGGGFRLRCKVHNHDTNALAAPSTSKTVTLTDSEGTAIYTAEALDTNATGDYYKAYALTSSSPTGRWVGYFTMTSGTEVSIVKITLNVETL